MTDQDAFDGLDIAILIPCYNEALTIAEVVRDFRRTLPRARIFVFDNNSSDDTATIAARAGARVVRERRQGKGNVVRRMFADIDADIYVMADGDGTYDAAAAPALIAKLIEERADMVVGTRRGVHEDAGREGHAFGNRVFNLIYGRLFGRDFTDIFSGYRAFTRRFAKSFPAVSSGFEIETEMSVHASQLKMPTAELELDYGRRPEGSHSKLSTFRDGFRILMMIAMLMKETRPAVFFGLLAGLFGALSLALATPVLAVFLETGLVPRLPTAVLAMGLMVIAFLFTACGLILDSVARGRVEQKRILYLAQAPLAIQ
ncbi:glycosyltransferase [Prosthecomicrobium sp. N25]|uniref:glycosyltransferase n=1 Tax=Prosthecomicrobium sp. N25 TaxID=3129254 RepID=UPI003078239D